MALELERHVTNAEPGRQHRLQLVAVRLGLVERRLAREHDVRGQRRCL
jgi:hypothetical protein